MKKALWAQLENLDQVDQQDQLVKLVQLDLLGQKASEEMLDLVENVDQLALLALQAPLVALDPQGQLVHKERRVQLVMQDLKVLQVGNLSAHFSSTYEA